MLKLKQLLILSILISTSIHARHWCSSSHLNPTEQTICSYNSLIELDNKMVNIYGSAKAQHQDYGQLSWLKDRRDTCGTNIRCIRGEYTNRIETLRERIGHHDITNARPWCSASQLNRTEKTICTTSHLRNLDAHLQVAYGQARVRGNDTGQKAWLRSRNRCGSDISCISSEYESRIYILKSRLEPYRVVSSTYRNHCSQETINELKSVCIIATFGELACTQELYSRMSRGTASSMEASAICSATVSHIKDGSIDPAALGLSIASGFLNGMGDSLIDDGNSFFGVIFKGSSYLMTAGSMAQCFDKAEYLCR